MSWSEPQQKVLAMVPKFSAPLSLFGSLWIMVEVLTDNSSKGQLKRQNPYHRLLFAMSFYDVLESIGNFFSTWPIPRGSEGIAWAVGTTASCSAQGFFLTLSVAVPIYNALLSLYYVLVVNYKYSDERLKQRVEPAMHLIAFVWAFGTALYSAVTGLLNNANLWCWIAPLPTDCKDSWRFPDEANCERGDNAWIYRWGFYFAPLWFCIFFATVCTIKVYFFVRALDKATLKYRFPERTSSYLGDSSMEFNASNATASARLKARSDKPDNFLQSRDLSVVKEEESAEVKAAAQDLQAPPSCCSNDEMSADDEEAKSPEDEDAMPKSNGDAPPTIASNDDGRKRRTSFSDLPFPKRGSIRGIINRVAESRSQYQLEYKRTLEVYHQALYYLGTFYLTHVWSTTNRILQQVFLGRSVYGLVVMHSFFDPLQGFLNYFVYQRPRYLRLRKIYPSIGRLGALRRMIRFSYLPEPEEWKLQRTSSSRSSMHHRRSHSHNSAASQENG